MEKVKLNNQIVLMRKYVKQAKVHIINKLVKEVKLLQNRKGNEAQVQKAKRKAERFLEEIAFIKKIKPDDVSKLALSSPKNWKDVLLQKNSSINDRCIAMLANYEAVKKDIEQFYNSNKELALKTSDLIKQWEEKNKLLKNSPKPKRTAKETERGNKNAQKVNGDNNKNKLSEENELETNSQLVNEEESPSLSDNTKTKNRSNYKTASKKNKISVTPTTNDEEMCESNSDDEDEDMTRNVMAEKESDEKLDNADKEIDRSANADESDSDSENASDSEHSDANHEPEEKTLGKKINRITNQRKKRAEDSNNDKSLVGAGNSSRDEESDHHDSESERGDAEDIPDASSKIDAGKQESDVSDYIKKMDSSVNKLKAITVVKLDELDGVDEIPIDAAEEDEISEIEEESTDEQKVDAPQGKRNDPFFLGCGDDSTDNADGKFGGFSNEKYGPKKTFLPKNRFQRENNGFFERKGDSSDFGHKRKLQPFSNDDKFSKRSSTDFKNERSNFQKDQFKSRNYNDKFQPRDKNNFGNHKGFKGKPEQSFSNRKERRANKSMDFYKKDNKDDYSVTSKGPSKEGKAIDKPLHPSWEAKRKQKELVNTAFQGKRMVFD